MSKIDLSPEALSVRRKIAELAYPGKWELGSKSSTRIVSGDILIAQTAYLENDGKNNAYAYRIASFIANNGPDDVIAMVDEIERLRRENASLVVANTILMSIQKQHPKHLRP